jgi:hypothetical protein
MTRSNKGRATGEEVTAKQRPQERKLPYFTHSTILLMKLMRPSLQARSYWDGGPQWGLLKEFAVLFSTSVSRTRY